MRDSGPSWRTARLRLKARADGESGLARSDPRGGQGTDRYGKKLFRDYKSLGLNMKATIFGEIESRMSDVNHCPC
jgi:hypothetical protein